MSNLESINENSSSGINIGELPVAMNINDNDIIQILQTIKNGNLSSLVNRRTSIGLILKHVIEKASDNVSEITNVSQTFDANSSSAMSGKAIQSELDEIRQLPESSEEDAGAFLRVDADGEWVKEHLPIAENMSF